MTPLIPLAVLGGLAYVGYRKMKSLAGAVSEAMERAARETAAGPALEARRCQTCGAFVAGGIGCGRPDCPTPKA